MKVIVTGGAGFIGSNLVRHLVNAHKYTVCTVDCLTYAGTLENLHDIQAGDRHRFEHADIRDGQALDRIFRNFEPDAVFHLAAQTHVDRSIDSPEDFISTNIIGTYSLLEAARRYLAGERSERAPDFRFIHISTDEVFGALGPEGHFTEETAYDPSSPYSASKASADHLARAWHRTYGLPVIAANCSNNYGPYQFPEKFIPLMIRNAVSGRDLPVYGAGENIRDWLFVDDHVRALVKILERGQAGESYTIGGGAEYRNIDVVRMICRILDDTRPRTGRRPHEDLIQFVPDRPGHDFRYAVDFAKIRRELGWAPEETFETGLRRTVRWYLDNEAWCRRVTRGTYEGERLGLPGAGDRTNAP